jgi:hypothetical protein
MSDRVQIVQLTEGVKLIVNDYGLYLTKEQATDTFFLLSAYLQDQADPWDEDMDDG